MDIVRQAMDCIQRNLKALALYLVFIVGIRVLSLVADSLTGGAHEDGSSVSAMASWIGGCAVIVLSTAAAQAVVFSRLAKSIDCPLWKISGNMEALRRYFPLWFVANTVALLLQLLGSYSGEVSGLFLALFEFVAIVYIPVGACVMFRGVFKWAELAESLRPLYRQMPKTLVVVALNGVFVFAYFAFIIGTETQKYLWPLVEIIFAYGDLLIFSATWLICMRDRESPEEIDFDF